LAPNPTDVLAFWFGDPPATAARPEWFRKDAAFDETIRQRFATLLEHLLDVDTEPPVPWQRGDAPTVLAKIVVLDQFTRNLFRGSARAFAGDGQAVVLAQGLRGQGLDLTLSPWQRWFVYLPFEHAESRPLQALSLRCYGELATAHPETADALVWAQRHAAVVERFGRYPHRNALLGRPSTAEEIEFLKQPGSSF
jgi:uncharacterized protein (DUF924 family)